MRRHLAIAMLLGTAAALFSNAMPAYAHADYKSSTPAAGEILAASPPEVSITFTTDIQKITGTYGIEVTDATGGDATSGPAVLDAADRTLLTVGLRPSLPPGRYVVDWTNSSDADGDPNEGAFSFYVATQPTAADLAADAELVGEEEPGGTATTQQGGATPDTTASPTGTSGAVRTVEPDGTAIVPSTADTDDDGGNTATIVVGIVAVAAMIVALGGLGAWLWRRDR